MLVSDIYAVRKDDLPKLYAYEVNTTDNRNSIAGKLAYRLKKKYPGHWTSLFGTVISDRSLSQDELQEFLNSLWGISNSPFKNLIEVRTKSGWIPNANEISTFVAKGLLSDFDEQIASQMRKENVTSIKGVRIERQHEFRGWVVNNHPSVSISVSSKIILENNLEHYIRNGVNPLKQYVSVAYQSTKGEVTEIIGPLSDHKERLMALAQDPYTIKSIEDAPDDVNVVAVRVGQNTYHYIATSLNISLTLQNAPLFAVSSKLVSSHLKFKSEDRKRLISQIKSRVAEKGLLQNNYDSHNNPDLFPEFFSVPYNEQVIVGKGQKCNFSPRSIIENLKKYGLYKYSETLRNKVLRMGVLASSNYTNDQKLTSFVNGIRNGLRDLGFDLDITNSLKFKSMDRVDLERSVDELIDARPDIILAVFPGKPDEEGDIEEVDLYHIFKQVTIRNGVGGQVVNYETLSNQYALQNILLGILGKTGNIPYVLANPLDFCDIVVGIDIAREKKRHLPGTKNAAAIARVYFNNGDFMRYTIHDAPIEGETVPSDVLEGLFPVKEFAGKKVVIHRDGYFRGEERRTLINRAKSIGAEFSLIEVIKREAPRLYLDDNGMIKSPQKGNIFIIDRDNAFLISSPPPFRDSTPRPVRIHNFGPISMKQAIRSVLALTQLHYGSLNPPRMPVTIHYSDKIASFALEGIKPPQLSGSIPFWL